MPAATYNIKIQQGASFAFGITISKNGVPEDISGWDFYGQVRERYDSTNALATFTFAAGDSNAQKVASLTPSQTLTIPVKDAVAPNFSPTVYVYDVFANKGGGVVDKIVQGTASIIPRASDDV